MLKSLQPGQTIVIPVLKHESTVTKFSDHESKEGNNESSYYIVELARKKNHKQHP